MNKKRKKRKAKIYHPEYDTCIGPSMFPTLRSGDGLKLEKYSNSLEVKLGDIIVYPHKEKPTNIVHRIVKLTEDGVITRGDNNNKPDSCLIRYEDIKGKVGVIKRRNKEIFPMQGYCGYLKHKLMLFRKFSRPHFRYIIGILPRMLVRMNLLIFLGPTIKTKIVYVNRGKGKDIFLVRGNNKIIGRKCRGTFYRWRIEYPYRLFIKTKDLP